VQLVHHSDAGSQGRINRSSQHRVLGGCNLAVGRSVRSPGVMLRGCRRGGSPGGRVGAAIAARDRPGHPRSSLLRRGFSPAVSFRPRRPGTRRALRRGCASRASCVGACSER
jgi:hypothetical protein